MPWGKLFALFVPSLVVSGLLAYWLCPLMLRGETSVNLEAASIVLAAVTAFAGLLIPLHYSISIQLIQTVAVALQSGRSLRGLPPFSVDKVAVELQEVLNYVLASDTVVFMTAVLGVSTLLEGACAIALKFGIVSGTTQERLLHAFIALVHVVMLLLACHRSLRSRAEEWRLNTYSDSGGWPPFLSRLFKRNRGCKGERECPRERRRCSAKYYYVVLIISNGLGIFWACILFFGNLCVNQLACVALIMLAAYYLLWLLLRAFYTPFGSLAILTLPEVQHSRTGGLRRLKFPW